MWYLFRRSEYIFPLLPRAAYLGLELHLCLCFHLWVQFVDLSPWFSLQEIMVKIAEWNQNHASKFCLASILGSFRSDIKPKRQSLLCLITIRNRTIRNNIEWHYLPCNILWQLLLQILYSQIPLYILVASIKNFSPIESFIG